MNMTDVKLSIADMVWYYKYIWSFQYLVLQVMPESFESITASVQQSDPISSWSAVEPQKPNWAGIWEESTMDWNIFEETFIILLGNQFFGVFLIMIYKYTCL